MKIKNKYYSKSLFFVFTILIPLLFQNCTEENSIKNSIQTKTNESQNKLPNELDAIKLELAFPNTIGEIVTINPNTNKSITLEKKENEYILSGDIILTKKQVDLCSNNSSITSRTGLSNVSARWVNCTVYYTINSALPNQIRVTDAIAHWKSKYPINFVLRTTQTNYIEFIPADGCYSNLGMIGGRQVIGLGSGCTTGNTIHEIGHALGFFHEHQRTDRENLIIINNGNIISGYENNFKTYSQLGINGFQIGQLDFNSIMMYDSYAFSTNGYPTIIKTDGSTFTSQRDGLSTGDLEMIQTMYNCQPAPPAPKITAQGPTYIQAGTNIITWTYNGDLVNADLDSIVWWYKKVNNNGEAPYAIGWGSSGFFMSVADTYYSDTGNRTSDFELYFTIRTTSGTIYTSQIYKIMQKGKYKLDSAY